MLQFRKYTNKLNNKSRRLINDDYEWLKKILSKCVKNNDGGVSKEKKACVPKWLRGNFRITLVKLRAEGGC